MKVLWLVNNKFSSRQKQMLTGYVQRADMSSVGFFYINPYFQVPDLVTKVVKQKWTLKAEAIPQLKKYIQQTIENLQPDAIIISDNGILKALIDEDFTCTKTRGAVYELFGLPTFIFDDPLIIVNKNDGSWIYLQDLQKLQRWLTNSQRTQPRFDYRVIESVEDAKAAEAHLKTALLISSDIETSGIKISCIGFSGLFPDGSIFTYVFPFINPLRPNGCMWDTPEIEIFMYETVQRINATAIPKTYQNGVYDTACELRYHMYPINWLFDTMHMYHSVWMEAKKSLGFITSNMLDYYRYWKDENKDDDEEVERYSRIPATPEGYRRYLRYNALDCYYTLLDTVYLAGLMEQIPWSMVNYNTEFRGQIGPYFQASMLGMKVDDFRKDFFKEQWEKEYETNLLELQTMTDDPEFNPFSSPQVGEFLYDTLGATPVSFKGGKKGERSVDKQILKFVKLQHPLIKRVIDTLHKCKEPKNNISKYVFLKRFKGRFLYALGAAATVTGRLASRKHMFRVGTNAQNIPKPVRAMFVADDGYFFFEPDYSQSDSYFVAFESQDENMIKNITDDRDTHSVHAAHFFKRDYDEVYAAHKAEEDWVEHPIFGIRQNTKKVTHGSNYLMQGETMYSVMGHEEVVATAIALGNKDAHTWERKRLVALCDQLINSYTSDLYPGLPEWQKNIIEEAVNNGNIATLPFGRTRIFFGDITNTKKIQRDLAAYFGQGGTGENINRACNTIFYKTDMVSQGLRFTTQTHDSIMFSIPVNKWWMGQKILDIMEQPVIIKGREFHVPADAKCGFTWSAKGAMIGWKNDESIIKDMVANENKFRGRFKQQEFRL